MNYTEKKKDLLNGFLRPARTGTNTSHPYLHKEIELEGKSMENAYVLNVLSKLRYQI